MSLNKLMSSDLVTIDSNDTLNTVKDIFERVTFHHILVLDNQKLVGVISDRDYFKSVGPRLGTSIETTRDRLPLNKKAHQIMNRRLVTVTEQATIYEVVTCFHENKVSCVPVINGNNEPVGIVSWRDVIDILVLQMQKKNKS